MEGEGMVAVVRGLRDAGLAVTLLDGNRQYTLLPNFISQPCNQQRGPVSNSNAATATQQAPQKYTADSSTESGVIQCDRDAQAVDGRYTSIYKSMHCNVRPTSPPVQLTEFPPQRPDVLPGHGNFQVGGTGSGATYSPIRASSPSSTFRGAMSWPDRGSVCSPRASYEADAFANSLRKYPCLSPDRSSEIMERLINYTQTKGLSKTFTRNQSSPTRFFEQASHHTLEPKATYTRASRAYEPEVTIRSKKNEDAPTKDRKNEHHERNSRSFDVRCMKDTSKRMRDSAKASTYPYNHPVCPTIKENNDFHDYPPFASDLQDSSNSVNMEIQAAVKMISKEVATVQRDQLTRKTVAIPDSPISSAGEDNVEGECYFVPSLDRNTSLKSIQTTFCVSDINLKPRNRKSAQTVCSTIDLNRQQNKLTVGRKSKSQEEIKVTNDDLKRSLLELIEEVSNSEKTKNLIRDELIKKLFDTDRGDKDDIKSECGIKQDKCHKYVSTFCPSGCDYVGDFQELVGKLRHCYGDTKHILRSEVKPFRISEYRQLDFVLKDWINNFNLRTRGAGKYPDRGEILSNVEDKIKELFKNRTKQDFDLKAGIVKILEEIPMEVNKSYKKKIYLHKLVDVLMKRMRNVVMGQQNVRARRTAPVNRSKKILTEDDIRDFLRTHLFDFFHELNLDMRNDILDDLENELIDVLVDSIDCIRCGHVDDASDEMELILQDLSQLTSKQANYITQIILQDFHDILNNCNFNQTYMVLHSNVNSGQSTNVTNDTDYSIGIITEEDMNANLDNYTNQLCQRINEWLDGLNLPQIHDRGFREVVVNDLAGDIVDRHKYIELNPNFMGTEEDELEALKYQIFKWINKLVGEENQETIGNAPQLMRKIKSVPVPMLTNPQSKKQLSDPMRPCEGETGPNTCAEENSKLRPPTQPTCCFKDPKEDTCCKKSTGRCCSRETCKNLKRQAKETHPAFIAEANQDSQDHAVTQASRDQKPTVQGSIGQRPTDKGPSGQGSTGQGSTSQGPSGQGSTGLRPSGRASTGQIPTGQAYIGQTPIGQERAGQTPTEQAATSRTPTGQTPKGLSSLGQSPKNQTLTGQTPKGRTSISQSPQGQTHTPTGQAPGAQIHTRPTVKGSAPKTYTSPGQKPTDQGRPYAQTAQGGTGKPRSYSPTDHGTPFSQVPQGRYIPPDTGQAIPHPQASSGGSGYPGHGGPGGLGPAGPGPAPQGGLGTGGPGGKGPGGTVGSGPGGTVGSGGTIVPGPGGTVVPRGIIGPGPGGTVGSKGTIAPGPGDTVGPRSTGGPGGRGRPGAYSPAGHVSPHSQSPWGFSGHPGSYTPMGQTPAAQTPTGLGSPYSKAPQGSPGPSGSYSHAGYVSPYSQGSQGGRGRAGQYTPGQVSPQSHISQGSQGLPSIFSPADQSSQMPQGTYDPSGQDFDSTVPYGPFPSYAPAPNFQNAPKGNYIPPGYFQSAQSGKIPYDQGQCFGPTYGQGSPIPRSQEPNQQWNSPTAFAPGLPSSTLHDPTGNFTQPIYGTGASSRPASERMSPEGMSTRYPDMGQSTCDPSQSMYGTGPDGMAPQRFVMAPDPMRGNAASPYYQSQMASPARSGYQDSLAPIPPSLKQINDDYDDYLKRWVQQIPIPVNKPSEEQAAEKARLGVYNGVWKGVTKMKLDPDIFNDPYNYQDVFDDEIESLFKKVPKSQELEASKDVLKAQLLQKTMGMNAQIRSTNTPATFKQQLIETIEYNLPKRTHTVVNEADPIQQQEEVEKNKLAEYYILYTRFKDEDSLKANVNKKTFLKKLGELLETIKKTNGIDMEPNAYANDIINSLDKVPIPDMHYMRDEADDILLGLEVENWISDLPLKPDNTLPLEKRRIRDEIAMKVQAVGSKVSYADSSFERLLKTELPKFLEKIPIQPGTNIDFVIEELVNRIRNLSKFIRQKSVSFDDQLAYDEFSRYLPASSSCHERSGPKSWGSYQSPGPEDDETWHSLQTTIPPPGMPNRSSGAENGAYKSQGSPLGDASAGGSCCGNSACTNRSHTISQMPEEPQGPQGPYSHTPHGQVPSGPYAQGFPVGQGGQNPYNQGLGLPPYSQAMPNVQGSPGGNLTTGAYTGQVPQVGPTSMPFGQVPQNIQGGPIPAQQFHSQQGPHRPGFPNLQGSPYTQDQSFGPALYGHGSPELQGYQGPDASHPGQTAQGPIASHPGQVPQGLKSLVGRVPRGLMTTYPGQVPQGINTTHPGQVPQGLNATHPCQGPQGKYGQTPQGLNATYHGQDLRGPSMYAGQPPQGLNPKGPHYIPSRQIALGPNDTHPNYFTEGPDGNYADQISQGPYEQTLGEGQVHCATPNNKDQSFGPFESAYGQIPSNFQGSSVPASQMPYQGPNVPQAGIIQPGHLGHFGQASPTSQGGPYTNQAIPPAYYLDQTSYADASAAVHSSMQAPRQNQTAQSHGPVSAASQVPDRSDPSRNPNVHEMAGGGLGILGVSQEPGPSTRAVTPQSMQPSQYTGSGVPPSTAAAGTSPGFYKSTDSKDKELTQCNRGTVRKQKLPKTTAKPIDINEKEIFNIKSVQTAFSSIDIKTTKCKYCEIRSKSQEELTKITKRQEVIKHKDLGKGDLQQNVTEWFEIHSDKVKVKLWGDKMQKLAEKLKKPGGEEKLRIKIEKYLKKVPDQFSEGEDDRLDYRKQIPNDIIRKLKKIYINPPESKLSVYRMEFSKYCSRYKIENFRKVIMNWVKGLNIKKRDFLGRHVKKDEVFKYLADKLEPLVFDRPQSDSEYKMALKCNIKDFIDELPLSIGTQDKESYVNKVTEALMNEIFSIESKVPSTYIQPTIKEIKEFVKDEITFFLEKSRVAISTKRMEYLELELVDLLLDLTDIVDIDNYVVEDVTTILKEIGKLPEYKAKYFSKLLLRDYKEFFFRESFFNERGKSDHLPATYSVFQNGIGMIDMNVATSFDVYKQRLVEEIVKWLSNVNYGNAENIELIAKDLASNIVDRHRYLVLNPNIKETEVERIEHLKYQIFKWTNTYFGDENTAVLEHVEELMTVINNIPKPLLPDTSKDQSIESQNTDTINDTKLFIEILTQEIYDWFHELPIDLQMSQDGRLNTQLMKDLAEAIEKGLDKKDPEVIANEVGKWTEKVFEAKLNISDIEKLKYRIKSVPYLKENVEKDPKHEKVLIRSYEDIIDEWIDTIPMESKKEGLFMNNRNEFIHELAVKICHIKSRLNHLPAVAIENKLQEKISVCMKKLPMKVDKQNDRDKFAVKLVQNIQEHDINDPTDRQSVQTNQQSAVDQLEGVILEWLKKNINLQGEEYQEEIMKEIANKIDSAICNRLSYPYEDTKEYIRMLDPEQNDESIRNTALQLKFYLQELNMFGDFCSPDTEDEFLISNIEVWLKNLPLAVADVTRFENQKIDFIESMMRIKTADVNKAVLKKEILTFMKSLPIDLYKKSDKRYLDREASNLILSLTVESAADIPNKFPLKNSEIINNAIKDWTNNLPLKYVYCPRELRSFIDDMSSVISTLLLDPDHRLLEQGDARLQREITKFLRRFPLQEEYTTESEISQMTEELTRTLKDLNLFKDTNKSNLKNVTVYGVVTEQLENSNMTDNDFSIRSIQESDINANLCAYTRQLVQQIGIWFDNLKLPDTKREGFKGVVINDLAGDIVDRHKYLELNPDCRGSKEDELEHLKYQIFKWINKLVGEENVQTIANAEDLMQRVQKIPVPMLVRPQDKRQTLRPTGGGLNSQPKSQPVSPRDNSLLIQRVNPTTPSPPPAGELSLRGESLRTPATPQSATSSNISGPVTSPNPTPSNCCTQDPPPFLPPPEEGTKEAIYDKYQKIFRAKCNALPIDTSTPDNAKLAELAKTGIYNGIVKTFFKLKSDPDIENDYGYFEFMLEEKIEEMLDILPQTEELKNRRHAWKLEILSNAIDMLDQLHTLSDRPSFRQRVRNKFNRKFARDLEVEECFLLQQGFLAEVADAYILETNYKEKDPIKANVYRNRLMKKVDELSNHLAKEHNVGFRFFKKAQLARIAMKVLEQVPIPDNDVLQGEAEEIQLADEVERWYKELPTKPYVNDTDAVLRKRMIDLLAKKLYDIHKHVQDPSKEAKMKHEMSQFLEKRAKLQQDQDLNINFMVDQLNNRLKNNWLKEPVDYSAFEKEKPLSSTFAQVDNHDFLAPLMDAAINTVPMPGQYYQDQSRSLRDQSSLQPSQENYGYFAQPGQSYASPKINYGENGNISVMEPSQRYISNSRLDAGQGASPPNTSVMSHQVPLHSMSTNTRPVLYGTGIVMSEVGPSVRCDVSQGGSQSPKSMHGALIGPSQVGSKHSPIASQAQPNISQARSPPYGSQFAGSQAGPGPVFISQPGPPMQSMGHTSPKNMHGALRTSQVASSPRMRNINQNLEPHFVDQVGPKGQYFDPSMPGPYEGQDQTPYQNYPNQGMSPTEVPGYLGGRGRNAPPPGPTAGGMDVMDGDYRSRCRCLEAYRRRKRCFEYDDRYSRFRPYKCPY